MPEVSALLSAMRGAAANRVSCMQATSIVGAAELFPRWRVLAATRVRARANASWLVGLELPTLRRSWLDQVKGVDCGSYIQWRELADAEHLTSVGGHTTP